MLGVCQDSPTSKGTAVDKQYQTPEIDSPRIAVPERISVAPDEIAADLREGLLALAVGAGMQVLGAMMDGPSARGPGFRTTSTGSTPSSCRSRTTSRR